MYESLKGMVLHLLRVPEEPPEEPAGTHESVRVFRASPHYLSYLIIQYAFGMVVLSGLLLAGAVGAGVALWAKGLGWVGVAVWTVAALAIAVKLTIFYVTTRLNYEMRWYIVTDRSLRIREGIWLVREVTLTFANVQNLSVMQGPLQRYFGISDLVVETAGGGSGGGHGAEGMALAHHGVLRGIENATEVKEKIQSLLRAYRAAGLGDPEDRGAARAAAAAPIGGDLVEVLRGIREEAGKLRSVIC